LGVDYRLAPEHSFPAAVEDATAAYRWIISTGVNPTSVVIAGDSAGGGLTLATLIALRDAADPLPAAAICMSPWVDLECLGETLAQQYLGDADPRTPLAAPLYADLEGLPPILIQVGSAETLLDDATRIAKRAKAAGVEVSLDIWEDMIHGWQIFAPFLPEGQQALESIGTFIRTHIR
jgi:acetyl esterase/lipase